ncbi:sigma-54-dependent transcriptional regulator [Pelagibaculum spongiae]|uniref:Sigma-54-dependent Fis family transcriptional regulator n=1 Tax=Pelagibaculum spongiae TaxID=2080658 RepID=A0A2V1H5E8_9GAMM|nr:sigma-54 dependent transcriptional regulator [Pelagibaculum spongiae]PVZ72478.1 sigma-54-dependent Fis family transcriptional regulator [Pelagibaculum spongiae]
MSECILIVDDDQAICRTLELHFKQSGFRVALAHTAEQGLQKAAHVDPAIIILDIRMPGRSGLETIAEIKQIANSARVIMITAHHDMDSTISAMKEGADEYIHKPIDLDELDEAIDRALNYRQAENKEVFSSNNCEPGQPCSIMVGSSKAMQKVFKMIGRLASTSANVLITGESGTGKELVAKAIHSSGPTSDGPFVAVNCAALVDTLLESEMFGHKKGSFSGAVQDQTGKFGLADGGTLFLDEVGELSLTIQAKLLRVLQEQEYFQLGGSKPMKSTARVIAATNVDLAQAVQEKNFREDLFYRLQVVNIHLPPMRERMSDLLPLAETLLKRINRNMERRVTHLTDAATNILMGHQWPGNVRELENALTKAVALCPGDVIMPEHLSLQSNNNPSVGSSEQRPLTELSLKDIEKEHVARILASTRWHKGKACEVLGVSRPRLQRLIVQHDLENPYGQ